MLGGGTYLNFGSMCQQGKCMQGGDETQGCRLEFGGVMWCSNCLGASQELVGASDGASVAGRCFSRRCAGTETCSRLLLSSSHWDAILSLKCTYLGCGWMR